MNRLLKLIVVPLLPGIGAVPLCAVESANSQWCQSQVDQFVQAKHKQAGVEPNHTADRNTLIRRLSFDLIGLPPKPHEVDAFVNDPNPDAYERLVERLLASPHFGERMSQFWLDLARYADSDGYHDDTKRSMWPYRDWVIDSFNENKPFDQFTIEQLAGDLLPDPTLQQMVATAFHRNGPTSSEDGANPDEYRARYAVDRVNTTSQVWLGLTVQCAECHDHKYDPISTKEYYQLFAFFNQTPEQPLFRGISAPPSIAVPSEAQQATLAEIEKRLTRAKQKRENTSKSLENPFEAWRTELLSSEQPERPHDAIVCEFLFEGSEGEQLKNKGTRRRPAKFRRSASGSNPTTVSGLLGNALQFTGDGAAVDVGQLFEVRRSLPFTVEAWLRYAAQGGPLFNRVDREDSPRGFEVRIDDGRVVVRLVDQWPDAAIQVSTTASYPSNQWLHLSVTYDGLSRADGVHIYVNGEAQDISIDHHGELETIRNRAPFLIGGGASNAESFHGTIDEVRFYKWALSSDQLKVAPISSLKKLAQGSVSLRETVAARRGLAKNTTLAETAHISNTLQSIFRDFVYPPTLALRKEIEGLDREKRLFEQTIPRIRVMRDARERRPTHVLLRGDFRERGEEVQPGTPRLLPSLRDKYGVGKHHTRLDLAHWLVRENKTHTSRVMANRLWALFLGRGIVPTLDDFGVSGELASHPELLDWLGDELLHGDWDLKSAIRQIVTSATYQQSSGTSPNGWETDPHNALFARGVRTRLSAEAIRDNALAISGLLTNTIGGPSVRPYQPAGLWREMSKGDEQQKTYEQSHGESLYRRGVYTFWKRSIHYPAFAVLDAPNREVCTSSRPTTNTPVQALALMNDPTFVEAARAFATKIIRSHQAFDDRIQFAFRHALAREASPDERKQLQGLHRELLTEYLEDSAAAEQLLSVGESMADNTLPPEEFAAWTTLAQIVLTLDEAISKE